MQGAHSVMLAAADADDSPESAPAPEKSDTRLRALIEAHFDFIWRSLRRLGVPAEGVDDAAQQVWIVAARRIAVIEVGNERAFLFGTALRVAADARRSLRRRREDPSLTGCEAAALVLDGSPLPDETIDNRRARALLDEVLTRMPIDLRAVFVLFELEEMAGDEIAKLLKLPSGTVASRLRRAREEFRAIVKRMRACGEIDGDER